jgi:hypothetical protein
LRRGHPYHAPADGHGEAGGNEHLACRKDAPAEDGGADSWRFSRDRLPDPEGEGEVDHFQVKQRRNDREIATAE